MANFDFKAATPVSSFAGTEFLFGAASQAAATPSIYTFSGILTYLLNNPNTWVGQQTFAQGSIAASAPLTITQTWSTTATYKAIFANITDSGPSNAASLLLDLQVGGTSVFRVAKSGTLVIPNTTLSSNTLSLAGDSFLVRDAADTLALRNSTTAQTLRVYNTFTDSSNYERGIVAWDTNAYIFGTENAGTGVTRGLSFRIGGTNRWTISSAAHLVAVADNTYDIGQSGANRPRSLYLGSSLNVNGQSGFGSSAAGTTWVRIGASTTGIAHMNFVNGAAPSSPNNGDLWFDGTDFKARVGGVTKTFTLV